MPVPEGKLTTGYFDVLIGQVCSQLFNQLISLYFFLILLSHTCRRSTIITLAIIILAVAIMTIAYLITNKMTVIESPSGW